MQHWALLGLYEMYRHNVLLHTSLETKDYTLCTHTTFYMHTVHVHVHVHACKLEQSLFQEEEESYSTVHAASIVVVTLDACVGLQCKVLFLLQKI